MTSNAEQTVITIEWPCDNIVPSKRCEKRVNQVLHRKGEWGRGRDLPDCRINEISDACEANGMDLYQALSLRRGMLRAMPGGMRRVQESSQMGNNQGQRRVAELFEEVVLSYVKQAILESPEFHDQKEKISLDFSTILRTESELNSQMRSGKRPRGPTPDILFLRPVKINGHSVQWIDAKLYYASAMLADKPKIPNGKLQKTASRYNSHYGGKGAFVFGRGFCQDLRHVVTGALLLDATPLDMAAVQRFQDEQT